MADARLANQIPTPGRNTVPGTADAVRQEQEQLPEDHPQIQEGAVIAARPKSVQRSQPIAKQTTSPPTITASACDTPFPR